MIIILSILIAMALLTIGLNVGIKDFKKLRGIVEDKELTEIIKKFPSNTEICKQTLKKLNKILQNNPSINYCIILLNIPSKIKAYYNESEIKNIKYGQYIYNFQFYDYLSENIKI